VGTWGYGDDGKDEEEDGRSGGWQKRRTMCFAPGGWGGVVVGKRLPPLQTHAFEWVRDWVRVIPALHHAINKVENPSLDGIRGHHDSERPHQSSSHLFPSSLFCFLVLANQLSRFGYCIPTLLETIRPFSKLPMDAAARSPAPGIPPQPAENHLLESNFRN